MFTIQGARLEADTALTPRDFQNIAAELGIRPLRARKIGYVAARAASGNEALETRWNGQKSATAVRTGDFIVTNLTPQRAPLRDNDGNLNVYVIGAQRFADIYESTGESTAHGAVYRSTSIVSAIPLSGGFDIVAPWGERQVITDGCLLCNGSDVYGNCRETFEATYQLLAS